MTTPLPLRIGTRGSPLALAQAHETKRRLAAAFPDLAAEGAIEIVVIRTTGDRITDRTLADIGGKGLFTKEIEEALIDNRIDIAVHSMKDVPTWLPDGLALDCILPREDPHDALFTATGGSLAELPEGAVVGTASLRRQALLLHARPDLKVIPFRGNVQTRLDKLASGEVAATVLAVAGLRRLGHADRITQVLPAEIMLPAVAQGAVGIERRAADEHVAALLAAINHPVSAAAVTAERAMLAELDGSCRTPIAALARIDGDHLALTGLVIQPDGTSRHLVARAGAVSDAAQIGLEAGRALRAAAGEAFFTTLYG
jgi:hydroxymethylbilane synthase